MNKKEIFKIWYDSSNKWCAWIKPVSFVNLNYKYNEYMDFDFSNNKVEYIDKMKLDTAIIVDLAGKDSIVEGVKLAKLGFRPIPIYNGVNPQLNASSTILNHYIEVGLLKATDEIKKINFNKNASPVFLLDSSRVNRYRISDNLFDNSWDVYSQDFPTSKFFLENGIYNIIVVSYKINKDLEKVLFKFQQDGLNIYFTTGSEIIKKCSLRKSKYKN